MKILIFSSMNKLKKVCWSHQRQNPNRYLYMYYNSNALSNHLLYNMLFLYLRPEGKKKKKKMEILAGCSFCSSDLPADVCMHTASFRSLRGGGTSRDAGLVADTRVRNQISLSNTSLHPLPFERTEPEAPGSWTKSRYRGERQEGFKRVEMSFPCYS